MELRSVWRLLQQQCFGNRITSSCSALDNLLGGGIPVGSVTEVAGESGSGKTQFCFQLSLNAQLSLQRGGIDGEAVYLDTENTFQPKRLEEMANSLCFKDLDSSATSYCSAKQFLSGIFLFRCIDIVQLLATSHQLFSFVKEHPKIKLVVVDSVAHCLRHEDDMKSRIKYIHTLAENFKHLASQCNLAVVLVNQVTTKLYDSGASLVVPALGHTWSHVSQTKLMLKKRNTDRVALLYQSPCYPRGLVQYSITSDGFRDHRSSVEKAASDPSPCFLTQTITNELMCNEFDKENQSEAVNLDEDIFEKWLLLSQDQLQTDDSEISAPCNLSSSKKIDTILQKQKEACRKDDYTQNSEPSSSSAVRSTSPVLVSRPAKKRRKLR